MHPNDGRVVSTIILQALRNEPITLFGDGTQTRSFCFVSDMVDGLIRLMGTSDDFVGPVNLGNPDELSINELAKRVIRLIGSRSKIIFKELPSDDPRQRQPDIRLAEEKLGWEPRVALEEGLSRTVDYMERLLKETDK